MSSPRAMALPTLLRRVESLCAAEGVAALEAGDGIHLFIVTDGDDPSQPASLYTCEL